MNTVRPQDSVTREHHFYVATAKFAFSHLKRGIVFVRDPITIEAAAKYRLSPLTLYGITPAGTAIHFIRFSAADKPRSLCGMLQEAWGAASGLRGRPDILKVNRHVAGACPGLANELGPRGIKLIVADGKDKRFAAALRNGQNMVLQFGWRFRDDHPKLSSIDDLNAAAMAHHQQRVSSKFWEYGNDKELAERTRLWLSLPEMGMEVDLPASLDWTPGPWLAAWQVRLPPLCSRVFNDGHGVSWLLAGQPSSSQEGALDMYKENAGTDGYDYAVAKAKLMVDNWPNKMLDIARALGITARELKWYLNGQADLFDADRLELLSMLSVECDDRISDDYEAFGPCVLLAGSVRSISAAYNELSCGGDLEYSFEALPDKGAADPSWRYLVFKAYRKEPSVIMVPRGSNVAEQLDSRTFINFDGQRTIKAEVYRDIVSSCGRACAAPTANVPEMSAFAERNHERLLASFRD